ncbi:hypothetical protein CYY_009801 [Polysphondylium violaceum]|uniref:N-acetyltransferase domain-containing protein n=1 Tax=Polysphondylium violaceum TaxID=133409 RepID=A0A8J4PSZ4_9MYCE|nr:hypothetical protein CYY_009801 [Polysphondylium violaceum]
MSTSTIKLLKDCFSLKDTAEILNQAFVDYVIPYTVTELSLQQKITSDYVMAEYSIGLFNKDTGALEGFILHAANHHQHPTQLYNSITGIIPAARGRAVERCYTMLRPHFESLGIQSIVLEAVSSNDRAVRAYEKSGFATKRLLHCYKGKISKDALAQVLASKRTPDIRVQKVSQLSPQLYEFMLAPPQSADDKTPVMVPAWSSTTISCKREFDIGVNAIWTATTTDENGKDIIVGYVSMNASNYRLRQLYVLPQFRNKNIASTLINTVASNFDASTNYNIIIDETFDNLTNFFTKRLGLSLLFTLNEMFLEYNKA